MNDAYFSRDGVYRYWLLRELVACGAGSYPLHFKRILWIMLNPSTADCTVNDPTIKQCMAFSAAWGFQIMEVVNLFALRATDPRVLTQVKGDPVGEENDRWIKYAAGSADRIVCAWGSNRFARCRARQVAQMLSDYSLHCLHINADGMPKHPLYIAHGTPLQPWRLAA
jgi:hypothetical protein